MSGGKPELWGPDDSLAVAGEVRRLIQQRTASGIGADGQPLKALDDGRPSRLRRTGRLIDGLRVEPTRAGADVVADAPYARFAHIARPFMALTEAELVEIDRAVERQLAERERALEDRR
ncbi:MAG: hypothetical protein H6705_16780 [Myxococcales bacterium]|nr:hypothetical protein [Myxococcales bacterium]